MKLSEQPKLRTKEEREEIEKKRTISDAKLLAGGAEYEEIIIDSKTKKPKMILRTSREQEKKIELEHKDGKVDDLKEYLAIAEILVPGEWVKEAIKHIDVPENLKEAFLTLPPGSYWQPGGSKFIFFVDKAGNIRKADVENHRLWEKIKDFKVAKNRNADYLKAELDKASFTDLSILKPNLPSQLNGDLLDKIYFKYKEIKTLDRETKKGQNFDI